MRRGIQLAFQIKKSLAKIKTLEDKIDKLINKADSKIKIVEKIENSNTSKINDIKELKKKIKC